MENYIVSARKYRPATFGEVIGQEALTTTLKNAISSGKLAHAYLFCGPRGVGKTTCARIFAKTINCTSPKADGEACGVCESCKSFAEGRSLNVYELDAASNNSVEDIRSLCDQVQVLPQIGRYKVFIIDEVHMLSTSAFNAFLKTLEEPPAHAIFILATTEKHKILPTILSRCQIYDFSRMEVTETVNHLKRVAEAEGIGYEEEALNIIARKADGGMRDALSIFDQVASFTGGDITYKKVIEDLNILDSDYYFLLTDKLLAADITGAMLTLNEILSKGFDAGLFVSGLGSHFRDLLMSRDAATQGLVEVAESLRQRYVEQASRIQLKHLYRAIKICSDCEQSYRASRNKRLLVEIALIEIAQAANDDESAGRCPAQKLQPIFNDLPQPKGTEGQAPAGTAAPAPTESKPIAVAPQRAMQTTLAVSAQTSKTEAPKTMAGHSAMRISIRQNSQMSEAVSDDSKKLQAEEARPKVEMSELFTEKDLQYQWLRYAMSLPKEQAAMSARLKNMSITLTDNYVVDVSVETEQVAEQLQIFKNSLLDYLHRELRNTQVSLNVRISEVSEPRRAYSRKEQFDVMYKKSEALRQFCQALQLELA